jgi:hypothetical protein
MGEIEIALLRSVSSECTFSTINGSNMYADFLAPCLRQESKQVLTVIAEFSELLSASLFESMVLQFLFLTL